MSLIIFLAVIGILVTVHEWGHYITARKLGITVEQFSIGFGPKLFSWQADGTEFMVCAVPLGGFVKMAGDDRTKLKGVKEEFYSQSIGHRALVIVMGPVINIVFAYFCFYVVFLTGFPVISPRIGAVMADYPAQEAGLMVGDIVAQIDDQKIVSWEDLQEYISGADGQPMTFRIHRGDQELSKIITPKVHVGANLFGQQVKTKIVGVQPGDDPDKDNLLLRFGPIESLGKAGQQMYKLTVLTFKSFYAVIVGSIPAKDALAGPVRIFDIIKLASERGATYVLLIMGIISANLAIINLFPLPILDGGHLFLLGIEKIRKKPMSLKFEENWTKVGFALLLTLTIFVVYNDISSMGWFDKLLQLFHR